MAYVRQPSTNYATDNSLTVLVDGLQYNPNEYYNITLYCVQGGRVIDSKRVDETGAGSIGNYRTQNYTFTGLTAGTTYQFYAEARHYSYSTIVVIGRANGDTTPASFKTTGSAITLPDKPSIFLSGVDGREIDFTINTGANTSGIEIDYSWDAGTIDNSTSMGSYSSYYHIVTVPSYNTNYTIRVRAYNSAGESSWESLTFSSGDAPLTVGQVTGLSVTSYGSNSIGLSWNHATNAWYYQIQYSPNGSTWYNSATSQSSNSWTVTGLSAATTYYFRVRGYQGSTYGSYSSNITARTLTNAPSQFEWTYPKVAGQDFNLTAAEWNSFTSRINQWRQHKGYTDWVFTTAYKGDIVYADIFNEARNGIAGLSPSISLPAKVYSGDDILAYHFNRIRDSLNSVT